MMRASGVVLLLATGAAAFVAKHAALSSLPTRATSSLRTPLAMARELTEKEKKEKYWQGDWVCADCGYIYDRKLFGGRYFEEQTYGFKCPQCSGPRRRYAKMVGDTVGVTLDGGDGPILFWSGVGFLSTILFGIWATYDFPGLN
mmetsp:Transcript_21403/g.67145  ORF Transcript_21403/g.67145 Transcript_21403/m.67145 type:complete len:144 (-) Transcript_21403:598-1029(-)